MKKIAVLLTLLMVMALASLASAGPSVYSSSIQIQNLSDTEAANINIAFYTASGTEITVSDTVAAGSSNTYFPLPSQVPAGFSGSAVISSSKPVAAIVNVVGDGFNFGASYGGFSAGASSVSLPLIMKGNSGFDTWFHVQNAGSDSVNVTVAFANTACTQTASIPRGAAAKFDQATNTCLPTRYVGAATVTATTAGGQIVATAMQVGATTLFAYNGFAGGGSTNVVMPLVNANNAGYITGIQIQNVGSAATDVTLSYAPAAAGAACTETKTIPANESRTFALYAFNTGTDPQPGTNNCAKGARFVGSASVTDNSASQSLVGVVNQLNLAAAKGSAYNAFNPAQATATAVAPLIMDRNSGFFTGMNVMNVGTSATTVTCRYVKSSDGSVTLTDTSASLAPNTAFNVLHNNLLGNRWVGSVTCTANAAGGLLIGQVNELGAGAGDNLFTYEMFNK